MINFQFFIFFLEAKNRVLPPTNFDIFGKHSELLKLKGMRGNSQMFSIIFGTLKLKSTACKIFNFLYFFLEAKNRVLPPTDF